MSKTFRESDLNLEDTQSFVLRISFNRTQREGGRAYPYFQLEHVNEHSCSHFKSLEEVCLQLTSQVEAMLARLDDTNRRKLDD